MTLRFIDSHCHLADPSFDPDREAVIERGLRAGVTTMLVMGENLAENQHILELCRGHTAMRPCLGHYPSHLDMAMARQTAALIVAHAREIAAIGEVGLDYRLYEEPDQRAKQREILQLFAATSNETGLALSVHSRSAGHYTIDLLIEAGARHVVMHAFDGKAVHALRGIDPGFHFSIPPSVVRSQQKQKLVAALPLDRLLLESDAPVLGPDPQVRNEPAAVVEAARKIAELKGVDLAEVAAITTANASRLFRL
ncbi:MAG: TatD family hydrolase [Planctomycetota bacterium]